MKYKVIAALLSGMMILTPVTVFAEDVDVHALESRIETLESEVAQYNQVLSVIYVLGQKKGLWGDYEEELAALQSEASASGSQETAGTENVFESDGCALKYESFEISDSNLIVYFDFTNNSDQNRSAMMTFKVQVFQNGKELGPGVTLEANQAYSDSIAEVMPGADPVRVAFIMRLDDMSEATLRISPIFALDDNHLDIPLSLQS